MPLPVPLVFGMVGRAGWTGLLVYPHGDPADAYGRTTRPGARQGVEAEGPQRLSTARERRLPAYCIENRFYPTTPLTTVKTTRQAHQSILTERDGTDGSDETFKDDPKVIGFLTQRRHGLCTQSVESDSFPPRFRNLLK